MNLIVLLSCNLCEAGHGPQRMNDFIDARTSLTSMKLTSEWNVLMTGFQGATEGRRRSGLKTSGSRLWSTHTSSSNCDFWFAAESWNQSRPQIWLGLVCCPRWRIQDIPGCCSVVQDASASIVEKKLTQIYQFTSPWSGKLSQFLQLPDLLALITFITCWFLKLDICQSKIHFILPKITQH